MEYQAFNPSYSSLSIPQGQESQRSSVPTSGLPLQNRLPAICFFWDIENCPIPRDKSAVDVAMMLRNKFVVERKEDDFICVCDGTKELQETIIEMNNAQITINHIPAVCKNAADDKLRSLIRKFQENHNRGDVVVLISGDVNFAPALHELRYQYGFYIIVLHPSKTNPALLSFANENYNFEDLLETVPVKSGVRYKNELLNNIIYIRGLPTHSYSSTVNRLRMLVSNTGGKIQYRPNDQYAVIAFPNPDATRRARARLQNQDMYGTVISADFHPNSEHAAYDRRTNNDHGLGLHTSASLPVVQHTLQNPSATVYSSQLPIHFPPKSSAGGGGPVNFSWPQSTGVTVPYTSSATPQAYQQIRPMPLSDAVGAPKIYRPQFPGYTSSLHPSYSFPAQPILVEHSKRTCSSDDVVPDWYEAPAQSSGSVKATTGSIVGNSTYFSRALTGKTAPVGINADQSGRVKFAVSPPEVDELSLPDSVKNLRLQAAAAEEQSTSKAKCFFIGNLDPKTKQKDLKSGLLNIMKNLVPIIPSIEFFSDNNELYAKVEFDDDIDSEFIVSFLSEAVLGNRSLLVLLDNPTEPSVALRLAVIDIFKSSNKLELPMFELFKQFQRKFDQDLDLGVLRRMSDIVAESEKKSKRIFTLLGSAVPWSRKLEESGHKVPRLPLGYCVNHCPKENLDQILDMKAYRPLLCLKMNLDFFGKRVRQVLHEHNGGLPLNTFLACFESATIKAKEDAENGSYLEHMLLSLPDIGITRSRNEPRKVVLLNKEAKLGQKQEAHNLREAEVQMLEEEIYDLLIAHCRSALPITQFADAYNRKYGKKCEGGALNVDKLTAAIALISTDFEIIGVGAERVITLTYKAQRRRFTHVLDRIRILRPGKQLTKKNFVEVYREIFGHTFILIDYGVSSLDDLFETSLEKNEIVVKPKYEEQPKKCMQKFAADTRSILVAAPGYRLEFVPFACSYRQVAGRDLVLKKYGVAHLVDLFAAIPDEVEVLIEGTVRYVCLKLSHKMQHLQEVIKELSRQGKNSISMAEFKKFFELQLPKHPFKCEDYGCTNFVELFAMFPTLTEVDSTRRKPVLLLRNQQVLNVDNDNSTPSSSFNDQSTSSEVVISSKTGSTALDKEKLGLLMEANPDSGLDSDERDQGFKPAVSRRLAMSFR